jgi:hypothetical protein
MLIADYTQVAVNDLDAPGSAMRRDELIELHYIADIGTITSIQQHGILCHKLAEKYPHRSVAMEVIQARRAQKRVPDGSRWGRPLHEYANLYFHARNPMLFKILNLHESLCVIRISTDVLVLPGVVVTDRNASADFPLFLDVDSGLQRLDRDLVFAEDWRHPNDPLAYYRHKSIKCAEVLVPDRVAPGFILGAYVSCPQARSKILALASNLNVVIDGHMFFQRGDTR